jgi:predicted nucleic acid-binding protein
MALSAASPSSELFWDSCVFTAFLRDERDAYDVDSIAQYLNEAREGKHRIYTSSLVFAEILPSSLTKPGIGSFQDFVDDFQGAIVVVEASPNVMQLAGRLRDLPYRKTNSRGRRLATPDAIILASCVYLGEALGVRVSAFHTFDDGNTRGPEGRSVPLLSYHEWCEGFTEEQTKVAKPVLDLNRTRPIHPTPKLPGT